MPSSKEVKLIEEIQRLVGKSSRTVLTGIGDDAAVMEPTHGKLMATVDMMIEGVHFDLSYMTAMELGHKALAVNVSDIVAMGGKPRYALVSLGIRDDLSNTFIGDIYKGMLRLARNCHVDIVGGNIVRSRRKLLMDVILLGEARTKPITRCGAKTGHLVAVTGKLGKSAAGLYMLKKLGKRAWTHYPALVKAHLLPKPRLVESLVLAKTHAISSLIDVSDGLAHDLHQLARASKVDISIDEKKIPISNAVNKVAEKMKKKAKDWALFGGEDYELLFTIEPNHITKVTHALEREGCKLHIFGEVMGSGGSVFIKDEKENLKPLPDKGWDHLK